MKRLISTFMLLACVLLAQAQATKVVEQVPEYPGGMRACMKFLSDNIRYPEAALKAGIEGKVISSIVIHSDGSVVDVEVVKSVSPELDAEAVRVLRSMPKWKPGMQDGKPVRVRFTFPIKFQIPQDMKPAMQSKSSPATVDDTSSRTIPEYPGGLNECMKFVAMNLNYPVEAMFAEEQGKVVVGFTVEEDGSITNIEIKESASSHLDKEAMRVVGLMPKWKPAMKDGKPVRTTTTIPVVFRLTP